MKLTIYDMAEFTWDFGQQFFLETDKGNFVWSDPDYSGDNTIRPFAGSCKEFFGKSYGRGKGRHQIAQYCGDQVKIINEE